jgi:hypothetical protein
MTKEKLKLLFQFYFDVLTNESKRRQYGVNYGSSEMRHTHTEPRQFCEDETRQHFILPPSGELSHLCFMCLEAQKFVDEGRIEKAMRWLGFLQGVLWSRGFYSLDDLKNHSRPETKLKGENG